MFRNLEKVTRWILWLNNRLQKMQTSCELYIFKIISFHTSDSVVLYSPGVVVYMYNPISPDDGNISFGKHNNSTDVSPFAQELVAQLARLVSTLPEHPLEVADLGRSIDLSLDLVRKIKASVENVVGSSSDLQIKLVPRSTFQSRDQSNTLFLLEITSCHSSQDNRQFWSLSDELGFNSGWRQYLEPVCLLAQIGTDASPTLTLRTIFSDGAVKEEMSNLYLEIETRKIKSPLFIPLFGYLNKNSTALDLPESLSGNPVGLIDRAIERGILGVRDSLYLIRKSGRESLQFNNSDPFNLACEKLDSSGETSSAIILAQSKLVPTNLPMLHDVLSEGDMLPVGMKFRNTIAFDSLIRSDLTYPLRDAEKPIRRQAHLLIDWLYARIKQVCFVHGHNEVAIDKNDTFVSEKGEEYALLIPCSLRSLGKSLCPYDDSHGKLATQPLPGELIILWTANLPFEDFREQSGTNLNAPAILIGDGQLVEELYCDLLNRIYRNKDSSHRLKLCSPGYTLLSRALKREAPQIIESAYDSIELTQVNDQIRVVAGDLSYPVSYKLSNLNQVVCVLDGKSPDN